MSMPKSSPDSEDDADVQSTLAGVNWDALSVKACKMHGATSAKWCSLVSGGYNVVRFLQLDDHSSTTIVARVPIRPAGSWDSAGSTSISRRISSEVATMKYVAARTHIPVPRVLDYSSELDGGGIGSPYILMTKIDGVPLSTLWDDMEDSKRVTVLRQVVDILLELASHRFDKIGSLIQLEGQDVWVVDRLVCVDDLDEHIVQATSARPFRSGIDYWLAYANAKLKAIQDGRFGSGGKALEYTYVWFMRSLIPALYDFSLDESGFPLCPGDFHTQNIMITEVNSAPRITGVIDWEYSSTQATSSFAQYPLFIMDHPFWDDDDPLLARNVRDRMTFDTLLYEAESQAGGPHLAPAFASSQGIYLLEQSMQDPMVFNMLYPKLLDHVYGPGSLSFSTDYYAALMDNGLLKQITKKFDWEAEIFKEAKQVLGKELGSGPLARAAFASLVRTHLNKFGEGSVVRKWLATES